jgi:hypothetical protein
MMLHRQFVHDSLRPTSADAYFDKIQLWLRQPISTSEITKLRSACGRGGVYVQNKPAAFDRSYCQRIELRQPGNAALSWIAARPDALINRAEFAIDYIFASPADRQDAFEFLFHSLLRRWHGKTQLVRLVGSSRRKMNVSTGGKIAGAKTRYDAGRKASNSLVLYPESFSRLTGEVACLHLEWRANNRRAVISAGITSGGDLVSFDHRGFWRKRLLLARCDPDRLGRILRNKAQRRKRKKSYRLDSKTGTILLNSVGTIQELLDEFRHLGIGRSIQPISIDDWLPTEM